MDLDEPQIVEHQVNSVLQFYFHERNQSGVYEEHYSLFKEHVDLFAQKKNMVRNSVCIILAYKSGLRYLADDIPELSDSLICSPFMNQLDDIIDSWTPTTLHLRNYAELHRATQSSKNFPSETHTWWKVIENVPSINGVPIDICREQYEHAVDAERSYDKSRKILYWSRLSHTEAEEISKLAQETEIEDVKSLEENIEVLRGAQMMLKTAESQLEHNKAKFAIESARKAKDNAFYQCEITQNQRMKLEFELEEAEAELNYWNVQEKAKFRTYAGLVHYLI